ncbi:hypothetical protein BD769DRAFT_1673344 [Suillus cothurnatus]|nr:hypothetical protein BD769DRAFT_1673344 [Suillus cothurnatus]
MPHGRPKKKQRNTSGLHNHKMSSLAPKASSTTHVEQLPVTSDTLPTQSQSELDSELGDCEDTAIQLARVVFDGLKISFKQEYCEEDTDESDIDEEKEDDGDPDWIPEQLQRKALKRAANHKSRPSKYKKGPDVMRQSVLDTYGFKKEPALHTMAPLSQQPGLSTESEITSYARTSSIPSSQSEIISHTCTSSVLSSELESASDPGLEPDGLAIDVVSMDDGLVDEEEAKEWEEELDVAIKGGSEIRD